MVEKVLGGEAGERRSEEDGAAFALRTKRWRV